jgi:hypothetical protein
LIAVSGFVGLLRLPGRCGGLLAVASAGVCRALILQLDANSIIMNGYFNGSVKAALVPVMPGWAQGLVQK